MFIYHSKYYSWYTNLISKAQSEDRSKGQGTYYELHHIVPKSMGGGDDRDNLVLLTAREHYIAHLLLTKCTEGKAKAKMFLAFNRIVNSNSLDKEIKTSRLYQYLRENFAKVSSEMNTGRVMSDEQRMQLSIARKGKPKPPRSEEHKRNLSKANKGKITSDETKQKISVSLTGKQHTEETKRKLSLAKKGKPGRKQSEETKQKISNSIKQLKETVCPHCNKKGKGPVMHRYHFNKCKFKN